MLVTLGKRATCFASLLQNQLAKEALFFRGFSGDLKQARSERGARDTRHVRRGKALFARLKLTPDLQATVKWVEERCYAFYRQRLDSVLQQLRQLQVAESCWRNQRVVLLFNFATKSVLVVRFTDPRQTCFAASDETPVYGVTATQTCPIVFTVFTQLATI